MINPQMNNLNSVPAQMTGFQPPMVGFPQGMNPVRPEMQMQMPLPVPQNPQANPASQGVSLYVGNLDPEVNEQRLYEHFVQYGHIINTKVMRDSYNGESRGFGFVTFANINDALRAKSLLNYTKILDREIRIALKRNPSELNQSANLFFKNLDPSITSKKLEEECSKYGSIISCVVKVDEENNRPLGYGYVQFENQTNAEDCVQAMNNIKLGEKTISVGIFLPKNKRQNPFAKSNLYIKCFPEQWDQERVKQWIDEAFSNYGSISSSGVFEDKNIKKLYAFVAFEEQESAQQACSEMNDVEVPGSDNRLYVSYAQDKATRRRTLKSKHMKFKNETNLYIKSLKGDVTDQVLTAAFSKFGKVTSVCIKTHEPKGAPGSAPQEKPSVNLKFGFINFSTADEAKSAFTECKKDPTVLSLLDQNLLGRGGEFVYYAQSKTVRQQYLRMQKKNLKTFKIIQDNVVQYYQLMKYFMPQNFRGNENNNRGGRYLNQRGGRGGNNFSRPGGRGGQNQGPQRFNNNKNQRTFREDHMNDMNTPTPMPNQSGTPTPQPNLMFQSPDMQAFAQMNGLPMQQFNMQHQMMQPGVPPQMINPTQNVPPQMAMQQQNMGQVMQPSTTTRDINWLKNNMTEFEAFDNHEKKNILGNLMYPLVEKTVNNPEHVPKITGMLIDLEVLKVSEIVEIMETTDALKDRIEEAIGIINETE